MINLEKNIPKILKKDTVFENILIIGGGNWARFYLNVLLSSFFKIKKIFIFSKYNKNKIISFLKKRSEKNVKIISNKSNIKKYSKNIIIVNKNSEHIKFIKLFSKKKFKVLVEKPIVNSIKEYDFILNLTKKKKINFFVGFQRFYAVYFHHFKNKYQKKKVPKKIEFFWFENRDELNNSNQYLENILYHIISILFIFLKKRKIKIIKKDKTFIVFNYGKCEVKVNFLRKLKKKFRKINFYYNKKSSSINWTNENKIFYTVSKKKFIFKPKFSIYNLQYQLFYFLSANNHNFKKLPNNIYNLDYFFKFIKSVHKYKIIDI